MGNYIKERILSLQADLGYLLPELLLAIFILLLVIIDLIISQKKWMPLISVFFLLIIGYFTALQLTGAIESQSTRFLIDGMLALDGFAILIKLSVLIGAILTVLIARQYANSTIYLNRTGEFHSFLFALTLGCLLLAMSTHLLMVYLSIELISISSYILAMLNFDKKSSESGLKYLLYGAFSSAFMLYGISWFYGFTGTLDIGSQQFMQGLLLAPPAPLIMAGLLFLCGLLFKLALTPFHIWAPDVYQGAPTPVVATFSVLPKLAVLVILVRFMRAFDNVSLVFVDVNFDWRYVMAVLAMLSMLVGNLAALLQKNLKRLMAYSSIAHAGFLVAGAIFYRSFGLQSMLFYGFVYLLMNFGIFLLLQYLEKKHQITELAQLSGLGKVWPAIGVFFLIFALSLSGIPPTAGFTAKLLVFGAVWSGYTQFNEPLFLWLFVIGLFNVVISIFYYLKLPYYLFFKTSLNEKAYPNPSKYVTYLTGVMAMLLILFFFKADLLMNLINSINFAF